MLYTYIGTIGEVAMVDKDEKYYLAPNVSLIRILDKGIIPRYLFHILQSENFKNLQVNKFLENSSLKNLTMEKIRLFHILTPSLTVQNYVVSILDKFDTLTNDLTKGLPKEIELRQKQYEFYREKLLSFSKE